MYIYKQIHNKTLQIQIFPLKNSADQTKKQLTLAAAVSY